MNQTATGNASAKLRPERNGVGDSAALKNDIRRVLSGYFVGTRRKVVEVRVRHVEGGRVDGFLKIRSTEKHENFLLDFRAVSSQGTLSSLEVDGKKVVIPGSRSRRVTSG